MSKPKLMYFDAPAGREELQVGVDSRALISVNGLAVLLLGLAPGALLALCERAISLSLRMPA